MSKPETTIKRSNIRQQIVIILIGFVLVMGIVGFSAKIGINTMQENKERLKEIVNTNNQKFNLLTIMSDAIRDRMLIVYDMTNTQDTFELDDLYLLSGKKVRDFINAREQLVAMGLTDKQLKQLDEQKDKLKQAQTILNSIIEQAINEQEISNISQITQARSANNTVLKSLLDMQNFQNIKAQEQLKLSEDLARKTGIQLFWLTLFAFISSIIVVSFIIRHMLSQGKKLDQALLELHQSNVMLERRVEERTNELMLTRSENMRMTAELDAGRKIQEIILPTGSELEQIKSLDIAAFMQPADEIGGDYYDILTYGDRAYFGIGDVTGHGLESGIVMLMVQASMRSHLQQEGDISKVLQMVNETLYNNIQRMGTDKNLSLALCSYQNSNGIGEIIYCGQHETIIIVRNDGDIEEFETDDLGFPVGLVDSISEFTNILRIELKPGDAMVLYTDGISEAANENNELFGIDSLKKIIKNNYQLSAENIKTSIVQAVTDFIGSKSLYDDISLVVIKQKSE
ncbi:MAG: SpoIIE family protein phosphatase [Gammaproteobacteria bacterium]|nr:SpoIIE family protein phosphatase [Gammaproteobacteria bacterium]